MKTLLFTALLFMASAKTHSQATVQIGAGASTSSGFMNIAVGNRWEMGGTAHGSLYVSDKMRMVLANGGYNATVTERFTLQVSGGIGVITHNGSKREKSPAYTKAVVSFSSALEYHFFENGIIYVEGFYNPVIKSPVQVAGVSVGIKAIWF